MKLSLPLYRHKMNTSDSSPSLLEDLSLGSSTVNNLLGLPLNVYVMRLILAGARETLASDFFSLNLAISEIVFALFCICYHVYVLLDLAFSLKFFMFSLGLLFTARPLFLCCICAEYYVGVVHPVLYLGFKPLRYRVACCCVVWVNTLVSCIYSICTFKNTLYLYGFFIQNLIFFSVILFCCCSVLKALKRPGPGEKETEKKKSNIMKRRAFKIILLIMISLATNFFLYMAAIPLQCCLTTNQFAMAFSISTSLALTTGFLQPLLYLHRAGKLFCFREL
ncbi:uncharacterized protein PEZ65_003716 [Lycodopsis pacificus]